MSLLGWACVFALLVAALLYGETARASRVPPGPRRRLGVALSVSGPILAGGVGLGAAALSGAWVGAALWTGMAVVATAGVGALLAP